MSNPDHRPNKAQRLHQVAERTRDDAHRAVGGLAIAMVSAVAGANVWEQTGDVLATGACGLGFAVGAGTAVVSYIQYRHGKQQIYPLREQPPQDNEPPLDK